VPVPFGVQLGAMDEKGVGRLGVAVVSALVTAAVVLSGALPATSGKVVPKAGLWKMVVKKGGGSGTGGNFTVTRGSFGVSSNHRSVTHFGFSYSYSAPVKIPYVGPCSGNGGSSAKKSSPIKKLKFQTPGATAWSGSGSATFHGVFTTARRAHGTAVFYVFISGSGCQFTGGGYSGTATWTAKR